MSPTIRPNDSLFVLAHVCIASAFVMLTLGLRAEPVHPRFGSVALCGLVLLVIPRTGGAMLIAQSIGGRLDMRALLPLESSRRS